jgi:hypothetical protein
MDDPKNGAGHMAHGARENSFALSGVITYSSLKTGFST